MSLCKYRELFGKERHGVHSLRIGDVAVIDVLLSLILAWILSKTLNINYSYSAAIVFWVASIFHWLFCLRKSIYSK